MKFKFTGEDNSFCIELLAYKLVPKDRYLMNGDIIDVPNDKEVVINSLDASGVFQRVKETKKITKKDTKKEDK